MRRVAAIGVWAAISLLAVGVVASEAWGAARRVVGTLAVQGDVRTHEVGEPAARATRVEKSRAPLLERTSVAVHGGGAVIALAADGLVGLRAGSRAVVEAREGTATRVRLETGEALARFPTGSRLQLVTSTVTLRLERLIHVSTDGAAEVTVRILPDGRTAVRVGSGKIRADGPTGAFTVVSAGEEATFAPGTAPAVTRAATGTLAAPAKKDDDGHWAADPLLLGLLGAVAVGGTVGGLFAGGVIDDDTGDDDRSLAPAGGGGGGSGAGSPFRVPR